MNLGGRTFEVDKANAKVAGVCAGLGEMTGVDANVVRIGFVLAAIFGSVFAMLIVYGVLAAVGTPGGAGKRRGLARSRGRSQARRREEPEPALDERLRAHERRMKEIDTFVAGSNSRLAREIEELRN
ncbi:MAG TPA: PspC domain-containing protein [Allosphingosinicella sp.]|nr:PspC domain-containing protein [Allosphingosinicella sp.]